MRKFFFLYFLLFFHSAIFSQYQKPSTDYSGLTPAGRVSELRSVACQGLINPKSLDLNLKPKLTPILKEIKHKTPNAAIIEAIKREKLIQKLSFESNSIQARDADETQSPSAVIPEVGLNFTGNEFDGTAPSDNHIAISKKGTVISVANSTIVYAKNGVVNFYQALDQFIGEDESYSPCDPVVIFDSGSDRFIMFVQECGKDYDNQIALLFSKTDDPNDGWWLYKIAGDQSGNGYFFDYPKIAVSSHDFFLTANLFSSNSSEGAMVIQFDKAKGFSGSNLQYLYYSQLQGINFTLVPVGFGQTGNYGPGIYLVASDNSGSDKISLYDINNDIDKSPQIFHSSVNTTAYEVPANAQQKGNPCLLDIGDCRALSGFYLNNTVHFVFHSDYGQGYAGINYNRLNVVSKTNVSKKFGFVGYDYGYPSVASFGSSVNDASAMIGFGRSSKDFSPQIRVLNVDNDFNFSNSTYVYELWDVDCFPGDDVLRWGDYTGCARNYNSNIPSVYLNGMYGNFDGGWNTRIAEVHSGGPFIATTDLDKKNEVNVFPNPGSGRFNLKINLPPNNEIQIELLDMNGKIMALFFEGKASAGENLFNFNKSGLSAGSYFLVIKNKDEIIHNEKIIIQ